MFASVRAKFARFVSVLALVAYATVAAPARVAGGLAPVAVAVMAAPGQVIAPLIAPAQKPGFFGRTRSALAQTGAITTQSVVTLVVVGLLVAILMPFVFTQLGSADQSGWTDLTKTIWEFLPAIIGIALLLGIVGFFAYSRRGR